jgi:bifunctional non-homologous end joining protein LigD
MSLYAFDLLELDGVDHQPLLLETRKAVLAKLLTRATGGVRLVEHLEGDGATVFAHARKLGFPRPGRAAVRGPGVTQPPAR